MLENILRTEKLAVRKKIERENLNNKNGKMIILDGL
jgi:hypothetical protein